MRSIYALLFVAVAAQEDFAGPVAAEDDYWMDDYWKADNSTDSWSDDYYWSYDYYSYGYDDYSSSGRSDVTWEEVMDFLANESYDFVVNFACQDKSIKEVAELCDQATAQKEQFIEALKQMDEEDVMMMYDDYMSQAEDAWEQLFGSMGATSLTATAVTAAAIVALSF